jgi:hypothetical protein
VLEFHTPFIDTFIDSQSITLLLWTHTLSKSQDLPEMMEPTFIFVCFDYKRATSPAILTFGSDSRSTTG